MVTAHKSFDYQTVKKVKVDSVKVYKFIGGKKAKQKKTFEAGWGHNILSDCKWKKTHNKEKRLQVTFTRHQTSSVKKAMSAIPSTQCQKKHADRRSTELNWKENMQFNSKLHIFLNSHVRYPLLHKWPLKKNNVANDVQCNVIFVSELLGNKAWLTRASYLPSCPRTEIRLSVAGGLAVSSEIWWRWARSSPERWPPGWRGTPETTGRTA